MLELDLTLAWNFATGLLIGALIGIERERHKPRLLVVKIVQAHSPDTSLYYVAALATSAVRGSIMVATIGILVTGVGPILLT